MKKTILFILILGLLAGILGYYFYQRNIYSKEVLKLEILGPQEVQAFQEFEYAVRYKNNGDVTLEAARLIFQYPENSLLENEKSPRVEIPLDDIYPGQERIVSFKARLFGEENELLTAHASLKYRPKNLRAFYESKTTFSNRIEFIPLTFEFDIPSKIELGRDVQFSLNYFSNSDWPLSGLRVKIEYPSGFEFLQSQPKALAQNEWNLPLLNKADGGRIEITGRLLGEPKEQKIFRALLGFWLKGEFILLKKTIRGAEMISPSLSIFQQINGNPQYIANPGEFLHYEIFFRNIGEKPFQNLFLIARLEGEAFDFESIKTLEGQFQRADKSLLWDWREIPKLRFLGPGEEGKVEFWLNLKEDWQRTPPFDKNFILKNRIALSQAREEFETKINSKLKISQRGYFHDEVFGNSGPLPPRVGESTTYTIIWRAKNYYNDVDNAKVKAILPFGSRLTGRIFPEDARLTFDSQSREIVWEIGKLEADGESNIAFQVSLLPQENQRGKILPIISEAKISGEDEFTGQSLEGKSLVVDTGLPDDLAVNQEQGIVQ